jgi:uncharacterized protein involved in exopolysaccharide biosynthesis
MNIPNFWTIRDYLHAVGHYKWRAVAFFAMTMLAATLYLCFAPRQYASESKLFVRVARENAALDPTLTRGETMAVASSREEEMNSIVEHLRCRYILERTLAKLDPDAAADPEAREEALIALGDSLYVASPRSSTVVAVQGRARSAERARKIVATAVDVYMEEHMRISRSQTSYQFFTDQSKHLDEQLETAQGALRDGKNKAGIGSIEDRRSAVEGQINAVEGQIHQVGAALAAADAKVLALNAVICRLPEPLLKQMVGGMPNDGLAAMRGQLFQLQVLEEEVRSKYTGSHPVAAAVHQQVQEVTQTLNHEEPDRAQLIAAISAQDTANQASLAAQEHSLQHQLGLLKTSLATLNDDEVRIAKLTRNARQIETQYLACAENKEQARMDQALRSERISNISIIQPATLAILPVHPRKFLTLFLAALGGMLGGVLIALISEQSQSNPVRR